MINVDFNEVYDKLSTLNEKWYRSKEYFTKFWFSDSINDCQNFLESRAQLQDIKALRLNFAPNYYAIADGFDLNHDTLAEIIQEELYIDSPLSVEWATAGFPKCINFEEGNYETYEQEPEDEESELRYENDYEGELIADCGNFEVTLYNFKSNKVQRPATKLNKYKKYMQFEGSELEKVLKPFLKRLYIYHNEI